MIARELSSKGIKTPTGKDVWPSDTVKSILSNEKYKGDVLLQKTFTQDFLTKKVKVNEGEVSQYYIEGGHEAIIEPAVWDYVQIEMKKRRNLKASGTTFSSKIVCGCCGDRYKIQIWHSTSPNPIRVWKCRHNLKKANICKGPLMKEEDLKQKFVDALNKVLKNRNEIIENMNLLLSTLESNNEIEKAREATKAEVIAIEEKTKNLIQNKSDGTIGIEEYRKRYDKLYNAYNKKKQNLDEIESRISENQNRVLQIKAFIENISTKTSLVIKFY